jgi:hypothetical protein
MTKKVWLWLACLVLLLSFLGCEAELPTSPDIPEVGFPIISYFRATSSQISAGEYSILSWNVHVSGLTSHHTLKVVIYFEIGISEGMSVGRVGTLDVHPEVTTVYTLTADVGGNSVSKSVTVEIMGYGTSK